MSRMVVVSVGPVTTAALKQLGFAADAEADESTMGSLVDAVVRHFVGEPVEEPASE